eukprot:symbB.v1.2.011317.t1/scaffold755.1/size165019/15
MMDACQVNLGAVSAAGKTTVSTADTATSKGKASTAETSTSNGTALAGLEKLLSQLLGPIIRWHSRLRQRRSHLNLSQTRHAQLRKMLTMETCKCSLNSSSTAINRLYIPMSLMSKPRTGIPSRPAHGQAHLQGANQGPHFQQHLQQSQPSGQAQGSFPQQQPQQQSGQTQGPYPPQQPLQQNQQPQQPSGQAQGSFPQQQPQQQSGQTQGPYPPQQPLQQNQQPQQGGQGPFPQSQQTQHQQGNNFQQQFPQQSANFQQFPQNFQGLGQQSTHNNYNMQQGSVPVQMQQQQMQPLAQLVAAQMGTLLSIFCEQELSGLAGQLSNAARFSATADAVKSAMAAITVVTRSARANSAGVLPTATLSEIKPQMLEKSPTFCIWARQMKIAADWDLPRLEHGKGSYYPPLRFPWMGRDHSPSKIPDQGGVPQEDAAGLRRPPQDNGFDVARRPAPSDNMDMLRRPPQDNGFDVARRPAPSDNMCMLRRSPFPQDNRFDVVRQPAPNDNMDMLRRPDSFTGGETQKEPAASYLPTDTVGDGGGTSGGPADVDVEVRGSGQLPDAWRSWEEVTFPPRVRAPLVSAGFKAPTSIQQHSWPILSGGRDLIGIAKTGSGKTLAFLSPIFAQLLESRADLRGPPAALILAPTRSLAQQLAVHLEMSSNASPARRTCCSD